MTFQAWSYRPRGGFYNALDERARITLAFLGIAACLVTWNAAVLGFLLASGVAIVLASRVRFAEMRRFVLFALFLVTMLVLLTTWTYDGDAEERARHALNQSLRMLGLVAFSSILPFTLDPARYGLALRRMGLPDKLAFAVELAFRFVPSFAERFERTLEAQKARGLELSPKRAGPLTRLRRLVPLIVPVLMDAILAGEDMADALDLRGFGNRPRTWCGTTRWGAGEWAAVIAGSALVALAIGLR